MKKLAIILLFVNAGVAYGQSKSLKSGIERLHHNVLELYGQVELESGFWGYYDTALIKRYLNDTGGAYNLRTCKVIDSSYHMPMFRMAPGKARFQRANLLADLYEKKWSKMFDSVLNADISGNKNVGYLASLLLSSTQNDLLGKRKSMQRDKRLILKFACDCPTLILIFYDLDLGQVDNTISGMELYLK